MEAIGLSFIDWVIIIIYFGFVLGIGMYLRKYTLSQEDFFQRDERIRSGLPDSHSFLRTWVLLSCWA